jgi:hypothetical protein
MGLPESRELAYPWYCTKTYEDKKEGVEMNSLFTSTLTAGARAAVPSAAHTTSKTATKRWFYANFYAVDEATGALIE